MRERGYSSRFSFVCLSVNIGFRSLLYYNSRKRHELEEDNHLSPFYELFLIFSKSENKTVLCERTFRPNPLNFHK